MQNTQCWQQSSKKKFNSPEKAKSTLKATMDSKARLQQKKNWIWLPENAKSAIFVINVTSINIPITFVTFACMIYVWIM